MTEDITYRPMRTSDHDALIRIIQQTWYDYELKRPWIAYELSRGFLYRALARHEFSKVALKDGEPVGLVLARGKRTPKINKRYSFYARLVSAKLSLFKEGREGRKEQKEEQAIDDHLLQETGSEFDGELILFILDEKARGLGIGSSLFQQFLAYQSSIEAKDYFLFTDDACTYEFYERKGLTRIGSYQDGSFHYYIYKGTQQTKS